MIVAAREGFFALDNDTHRGATMDASHTDIDRQMINRADWGRLVVWTIDAHLTPLATRLDEVGGIDQFAWYLLFSELRDELAAATRALSASHEVLQRAHPDVDAHADATAAARDANERCVAQFREALASRKLLHVSMTHRQAIDDAALAKIGRHTVDALRAVARLVDDARATHDHAQPPTALRCLWERAQAQAWWTIAYRRVGNLTQHALAMVSRPSAASLARPTPERVAGLSEIAEISEWQARPERSLPAHVAVPASTAGRMAGRA